VERLVNPFEIPGRWYKANLHTHTTVSDGKASPAQRITQYRRAGYDVLALTDHSATHDVRNLSDGRMLILSGMEFHLQCPTSRHTYHLVALNLPPEFRFGPKEMNFPNRCIAKVRRAGGLTFLGHPYWSGHSYRDFKNLKGLEALEVYNAGCDYCNRACSENEWAYALDHGLVLPIVGVDDTHTEAGHDLGRCWTWLKMPSPSPAGVLRAVRTGASYASCGPKIHHLGLKDGRLSLRCSPATKIQFTSRPTKGLTRWAENGKTITAFSIDAPELSYVRAVVTDSAGQRAWTNPILL